MKKGVTINKAINTHFSFFDELCQWFLATIPTRQQGRVGLLLLLGTCLYTKGVSQNTCADAQQICGSVTVPARTGAGTAESGPTYGCLTTVPRPSWLMVKIGTSGTLSFSVTLTPSADVDFICWGPFAAPACGTDLSAAKTKACDYSTANGGTATIGTVVAGEYYMILLTNFAGSAGNIALNVTGASNATLECTQPGCVVPNLKLWLKANASFSPALWADKSGNGNNATQATISSQPTTSATLRNFNPVVTFDGVDDQMNIANSLGLSGTGAYTVFSVFNNTATTGNRTLIGGNVANSFTYDLEPDNQRTSQRGGTAYISGTATLNSGIPQVTTTTRSGNNFLQFANGAADGIATNAGSFDAPASLYVGSGNGQNYYQGDLAELIAYSGSLSATEIEKIESYLAIKYGVTLAHNYRSGSGIVLWDKVANAAYHNRVTVIGSEDCMALSQRQSRSVHTGAFVTIGIDNIIATSNAVHNGAFDNNAAYLAIGDNAATPGSSALSVATAAACPPPGGLDQMYDLRWKVIETGTIESILLRVPAANLTGLNTAQPLYLIVADDANFNTNVRYVPMSVNSTNRDCQFNFNGIKYFTFGGTATASTYCSGSQYVRWVTQGWTAGSLTKNISLSGGLAMNTTVTNADNILRSGYPKLYGGYPMLYIQSNSSSKSVVWASTFNQKVMGLSFSVYDLDAKGLVLDNVEIKGYNGATAVSPVLSKTQSSTINISGSQASGSAYNLSVLSNKAKLDITFNVVVDKVEIVFKNNKSAQLTRAASIAISDFAIYCPETINNSDLVILKKIAPVGDFFKGDTLSYTFKFNNINCTNQTVAFNDILPSGFTWVAGSFSTAITGGIPNSYGGTNTLSISGLNLPAGISTFTADAVANGTASASPGTVNNNQATFTINGNTYQSDNPNQTGATDPTPVNLVTALPKAPITVVKSISPATVNRSGEVTFTYAFNNTNATAITVDFEDPIQPDTVAYKAASLQLNSLTGTPNAYANDGFLTISGLSIPAGTSSVSILARMNSVASGIYDNDANLLPTATIWKQEYTHSNSIAWVVQGGASFTYPFDCTGATVIGSFMANGLGGQTGSVIVPINVSSPGTATFMVSGGGFTGSLSTNIINGQSAVTIPITYDGSGAEGSHAITISSPNGSGTCSAQAIVEVTCQSNGGQIGH